MILTLPKFIEQMTDRKFAEMFGISQRAACAYRLGKRIPRPALAAKIVKRTPVTWAGIYGQGPSNWRQGAQAE
jgi:hypothetical protein